MSFQDSCIDIRIEVRDGYTVLLAGAGIGDGAYEPAELNLDEGICNSDGKIFNNTLRITILIQSFYVSGYFSRDGANFTDSAENIDLSFRDDGVWLEADLPEVDEGDRGRQGINLSEHVENQNGQLVFI